MLSWGGKVQERGRRVAGWQDGRMAGWAGWQDGMMGRMAGWQDGQDGQIRCLAGTGTWQD
jgi:hypothetical protein